MLEQAGERVSQAQAQKNHQAVLSRLTAREQQVLERIVAGRLNKQIAGDLNISIKTVEAHRANIMEKLEVPTVADLMKIALTKEIGRAHVLTPVTNAHIVCRLHLANTTTQR